MQRCRGDLCVGVAHAAPPSPESARAKAQLDSGSGTEGRGMTHAPSETPCQSPIAGGGGGLPQRPRQCAGGYARVWGSRGRWSAALVHRRWGDVLLGREGGAVVPRRTGAAPAPRRPSRAGAGDAPHPQDREVRGVKPPTSDVGRVPQGPGAPHHHVWCGGVWGRAGAWVPSSRPAPSAATPGRSLRP